MPFRPLNRQGGERRLNVAVTRAKERVLVVASMTAAADQLVLFGGRARVNQITFAFNGTTGVVTGTAANSSGAIGPVSFSGGAT